jgi:hypothetical protein
VVLVVVEQVDRTALLEPVVGVVQILWEAPVLVVLD